MHILQYDCRMWTGARRPNRTTPSLLSGRVTDCCGQMAPDWAELADVIMDFRPFSRRMDRLEDRFLAGLRATDRARRRLRVAQQ